MINRNYINKPTLIHILNNISRELQQNIYIKRDDINYIGGGGNKLRKLEYIIE